jgi:thiamine biosynthesis lipoprotein
VARISRILWTESQGRFDPTVWPLKALWRSAVVSQQVPDRAAIAAVLSHMGFGKVQVCALGRALRVVDPHTKVEFGAIAKGYAVDQVKRVLESEGVLSGLVQVGGEIACFGPPSGQRWRLGIQHPKKDDQIWGTIAHKEGLRVSTSGNYRQPLQIGSQSYYHIFDPTTGLPASDRVLGVTTADLLNRANNSMLDGAATAITVLGVSKGLALANRLGIEALVLVEDEQAGIVERMTDGFSSAYERFQK